MNRFESIWLNQIKRRGDLAAVSKVLVACSGGGDSAALLAFLWSVRKSLGIELLVAHANHGLRAEAQGDAALVRSFCRLLDLDYAEADLDVKRHARRQKVGLEMAARELRWAWLKEEAASSKADCIATGHSLDDHTETIFIRLTRGGGLGALTPLPARQELRWSPLVEIRREDLRNYLRQKNIPWREDLSNEDAFTSRNRWRKLLITLREEAPTLDRHLMETHLQLSEMLDWRDQQVSSWEGIRWESSLNGIKLNGAFQEVELRWVLERAFQKEGWLREADLLRDLSRWLGKCLNLRSKKTKNWGGWTLESLNGEWRWWLHLPISSAK